MHLAPDMRRICVTFSPPLPMTVAASALEMMARTWSQFDSSWWPLEAGWAVEGPLAVEVDWMGWVSGAAEAAEVGASGTTVSPWPSLVPFWAAGTGASGSLLADSEGAEAVAGSGAEGACSVDSSLTTLSSAGRFASGWSPGPEGDEGSSSGRFWLGAVAVVGEADIVALLYQSKGRLFLFQAQRTRSGRKVLRIARVTYSRGLSKENLLEGGSAKGLQCGVGSRRENGAMCGWRRGEDDRLEGARSRAGLRGVPVVEELCEGAVWCRSWGRRRRRLSKRARQSKPCSVVAASRVSSSARAKVCRGPGDGEWQWELMKARRKVWRRGQGEVAMDGQEQEAT